MNLTDIKNHYQNLPDQKLLDIAANKETLTEDAIRILAEELESRHLFEGLVLLEQNTEEPKPYTEMSLSEIQAVVAERMMGGEPIESIKADMEANGIDVKKLLNQEAEEEEGISEFIINAKKQKFSDQEIKEAVKAEYNLEEEEIDSIKKKMKSRGKGYVIAGVFLIIISVVIFIFALLSGRVILKSLFLAVVGIGLVIKGRSQKKV